MRAIWTAVPSPWVHLCFAVIFLLAFCVWVWALWIDQCGPTTLAPCLRDTLHGWQTGLGAFFGLVGLAWTAFIHADLNRSRDRHRLEIETKALAASLYAEVSIFRSDLAYRIRHLRAEIEPYKDQEPVTRIDDALAILRTCDLPDPKIYSMAADRIGLLSRLTYMKLFYAYGCVDAARYCVALSHENAANTRRPSHLWEFQDIEKRLIHALQEMTRAGKSLAIEAGIDHDYAIFDEEVETEGQSDNWHDLSLSGPPPMR